MIEKIVCKKFNTKHNIGITEKGEVLAVLPDKRIVACEKIYRKIKPEYEKAYSKLFNVNNTADEEKESNLQ